MKTKAKERQIQVILLLQCMYAIEFENKLRKLKKSKFKLLIAINTFQNKSEK